MKIGDIQHVTHSSGEPLAKPYYRLLTQLKEPEPFHRKFFPHQKSIAHWKSFKTRKEAEQYAKENL
jgi:hypothetical protein